MITARRPCDEALIRAGAPDSSCVGSGTWVLAVTILGSSMAFIDSTVVNVALPALQSALHASVSQIQWITESYDLLGASLLLLGGALGDLYGRARVFTFGVLLFTAASILCGFAPSVAWLIAARSVQGVGSALLVPTSLALLSASFDERERGRAIGIWSAFTSITTGFGPVLGGWIVEHASWRWIFFINVPIAVAVVAITQLRVPESRNQQTARRRLDWQGTILATLGLGAITYALIEAPHGSVGVKPIAVFGLLALGAFVLVEARSPAPMMPLELFRSRNFSAANLLTFFLYAALGGIFFFLPLDLIQVQRYSATQAGGAMLPFIVLMFVFSGWAGSLVDRFGPRLPLTVGPFLTAIGFALFLRTGASSNYWTTWFPAMVVLGVGMVITVAPLTTTVMSAVPQTQAGAASGINNAVSGVAGLLAVAVFGWMLYAGFNHSLDQRLDALALSPAERRQVDRERPKLAGAQTSDPRVQQAIGESFVAGYRVTMWVAIGLALASGVVTMVMMEKPNKPI